MLGSNVNSFGGVIGAPSSGVEGLGFLGQGSGVGLGSGNMFGGGNSIGRQLGLGSGGIMGGGTGGSIIGGGGAGTHIFGENRQGFGGGLNQNMGTQSGPFGVSGGGQGLNIGQGSGFMNNQIIAPGNLGGSPAVNAFGQPISSGGAMGGGYGFTTNFLGQAQNLGVNTFHVRRQGTECRVTLCLVHKVINHLSMVSLVETTHSCQTISNSSSPNK